MSFFVDDVGDDDDGDDEKRHLESVLKTKILITITKLRKIQ